MTRSPHDPTEAEAPPAPIRIADRWVGRGAPCLLVAEIGINHNGDLDLARRTIDAAAAAGADSVKFQNYRTEDFLSDRSLTWRYVSRGQEVVEPQFDMFKRCELDLERLRLLRDHCLARGVFFHSTPTSEDGLRDLVELGAPVLKNGSDYLGHLPLVKAMGATGLPTVLSTGMATPDEVDEAVAAFRATGNEQLILLHCTSSYPTPPAETHLRKMPALGRQFRCLVGFSDHTEGIEAAVAAVALGACWIEKHFTLDRNLPGPDHRFSADAEEFAALATAVRRVEAALGAAELGPAEVEREARLAHRLSCVAARSLPAGHELVATDIAFRRPGRGLRPALAATLVGRRLRTDVEAGHVLGETDLG